MRISHRLNFGFLAIILWTVAIGHISLYQLGKISDFLNNRIPESIQAIHKTEYLNSLAKDIRYNEEVLVKSAKHYALTQNKKWEQSYKDTILEYDNVIKGIIDWGVDANGDFLSHLSENHSALMEIENASIELVNEGKESESVTLLESDIYSERKRIQEQYIEEYIARTNKEHDDAIANSIRTVNFTMGNIRDLTKSSGKLITIFAIGALVLALGSGFLISRSIYLPLEKLKAATIEIGKGNLDTNIEIHSDDEIGRVAASFKKMTDDLKKTTTSIDNLRREIAERKKAEENAKIACEKLEKANIELKQIQSQQVQNAKLVSIGQLAAGVAHELNTPIGFVSSNFETLKDYVTKMQKMMQTYSELIGDINTMEKSELMDKVKLIKSNHNSMKIDYILNDIISLFNDSQEGIERVTTIVRTLRDFSRIDHLGNYDNYDINDGIKTTLIVANNEIKYHADVITDLGDVPPIICDAGQINQVLLNIIVNASQAIKSQEKDKKGIIKVRTYATAEEVICEITDNGPGIDSENLSQIFDPFFTTKPLGQGTGLGLSISYDIIKVKHHGELFVDSSKGEGTKFTIKLPISRKNIDAKQEIVEDGNSYCTICG